MMSEYINCYIGKKDAEWFQEMKDEARTRAIYVTTFPVRQDDIEVSMRIKSDEERAKERVDMLINLNSLGLIPKEQAEND